MARVTVEDCLEAVDNQYDLIILAKERTLQIAAGDPALVEEDNDKKTVISLREIGDKKIDIKKLTESTIDRARDHPEDATVQEDFDAPEGDAFEEIYKGEVSKSGLAILPSKRSRKVPAANAVADDDDDAPSSDADLLLRCARAVAVHYLSEQLAKRGYDSRSLELAEAVVESMPTDQLAAAMTKDPRQLLRLVLHKGVQAGFDFAQEWFEECTEELKEDVRTKLMHVLDVSEEQCDKIAEQMAGGL